MAKTIVILLMCLEVAFCENKYSKSANEDANRTKKEFRMEKLNFIYRKAATRLSLQDTKSLYLSLLKFDKLYLQAKEDKVSGKDPHGFEIQAIKS